MDSLLETIAVKLSQVWRGSPEIAPRGRSYRCECQRAIFFRNSECLGCRAALGYLVDRMEVRSLRPGPRPGTWVVSGETEPSGVYRRCANFQTAAGCNWLLEEADPHTHCRSCRLNRHVCNQTDADNRRYWCAIENAKRRLVSQLLGLKLPVKSQVCDDPDQGVMLDFLRTPKQGPRVLTGHAHGLITLNVEEADDSIRERTRQELREPYRTLLGHLRHEVGHYYWDRLIAGTGWHDRFRDLFGDERADYAAALQANYEHGPPPDWKERCISSYAATHPWEDWAECWAHYLHLLDGLDTALGFGLSGVNVESRASYFQLEDLYDPTHPNAERALSLVNSWLDLTAVLNEMAQSMGQPDFYPFEMSRPVLRKLHFIHLVVKDAESNLQ